MDFDVVIKNGHIIDGVGNPWFKADIGVKDGRIAKISRISLKPSGRVVNADGLIVCPGFINLHSHSDGSIYAHNNAENCLSMGLVTELTGQCGSSVAPITEEYKEMVKTTFRRRLSSWEEVDWLTFDEWVKRLEEKGVGINVAYLAGHGTIRTCVMGDESEGGDRVVPTEDEMDEMKAMLEGAMKEGAFGLSTGLNYAPGRNAHADEIVELAKVVAKYGGVYSSHMRCEGDKLLEATREFVNICEIARLRGTISHHKASGWTNFGKVVETLRMVEAARSRGVDVIIDQYPWRIGGTIKSLGTRFTASHSNKESYASLRKELVEKLKDDEEWKKIKANAVENTRKEEELHKVRNEQLEEIGGWTSAPYAMQEGGIILHSKSHPELEGRTLEEVANSFGLDDILEGIRALLIEDEGYTSAGNEPYSECDIITILKYPWTTVSTDQYALDNSKVSHQNAADALCIQHPRGWGTYPKILEKYVREEKVLTIEEAIRKMTSLPAQFLGLQDRGIIRENFWADIVIFDPEQVENLATYENPQRYPRGIPYVLVNGQMAINKGERTGALAGKTLRHMV